MKWEYLVIETVPSGDPDKDATVVIMVNGSSLANKSLITGMVGNPYKSCPEYIKFIQEKGLDGWEAVSMACIADSHRIRVLFKRQLP